MKGRKHPIKEEDIVPSDEGSQKKGADDDDNDEEDSNSDKNEEDEGKGKSSHMASKGDSDDGKDENDKDNGVPQVFFMTLSLYFMSHARHLPSFPRPKWTSFWTRTCTL